MPLAAVALVLLSVSLMLVYGIPATERRLSEYAQSYTFSRAAAVAEGLSETERAQWERLLRAAGEDSGTEILVVNAAGEPVVCEGPRLLDPPPEEVLRAAATGDRVSQGLGGLRAAVVPLSYQGEMFGGVVFVSRQTEVTLYQIFLRGGVEAAAIALVLGGGTALVLATLLSRRVERLSLGARSIAAGELSSRIEPGFKDELGELAGTFNSMAARLEGSFERIEESRETLDAILNNLSEGVLATDLVGGVVFMNHAARRLLQVGTDHEAANGSSREPPYGPPAELPDPWKEFSLPEAVARCAQRQECGAARVKGEETFLQIQLEHLPQFDDHSGGVLVVIQDLSEGRRLEAEQQRFLANAAHELKTPITTILGSAELLLTEDEDDPEVRRRFLDHIYGEARRMQRLADTLLRLSRTGWDLREPDLQPLELGTLVGEVIESAQPLADRAGVRLTSGGSGGRVNGDREWLEQAVLTLLGNAIKHSPSGTEVRLNALGNSLRVEDEGAGIGEEDLPHVFERFYRGRGVSEGFGLGLPICKELVERMGGEVSVRSGEDEGTVVQIYLPEADGSG